MAFTAPLDIANRACQRLGVRRLDALTDSSTEGVEMNFVYDKLRLAELERNLWRFATRRVVLRAIGIDSVIWTPVTWTTAQAWSAGAVVAYAPTSGPYSGTTTYWQLTVAEGNSTVTPDLDPLWKHYVGPVALDLYNTGTSGTGSSATLTSGQVYQSGEVVLVPATWSSGTTYAINQVVARQQTDNTWRWYVSLQASNLNHDPRSATTYWQLWTSQGRGNGSYGETATNSPIPLSYPAGYSVYLSLFSNNADNPKDGTANWLALTGTVVPLNIVWPIGAGPSHDLQTMNTFHLPNAFLKRAPTDPKGGQMSYLGAASGSTPEDWVFEDNYFATRDAGPLMMRFVADITDVTAMDTLFCEMLGAGMAMETCDRLTQDTVKLNLATAAYNRTAAKARTSNAIEIGPITPVENRYVTVRA